MHQITKFNKIIVIGKMKPIFHSSLVYLFRENHVVVDLFHFFLELHHPSTYNGIFNLNFYMYICICATYNRLLKNYY